MSDHAFTHHASRGNEKCCRQESSRGNEWLRPRPRVALVWSALADLLARTGRPRRGHPAHRSLDPVAVSPRKKGSVSLLHSSVAHGHGGPAEPQRSNLAADGSMEPNDSECIVSHARACRLGSICHWKHQVAKRHSIEPRSID